MRMLVTGANGFVGRKLSAELFRQKYGVVAAMRNEDIELAKYIQTATISTVDNNTDWLPALSNVDVVVHLAARVHVMRDHATDPLAEFRKVNVEGTLNLAKQASLAGVKRFIFMSSVKVNGEHTESDLPFTEEHPVNPQDAYGISKLEAEQGLMLIARQTGMEIVIIRPPLVYGPGVKANFASMMRMLKRSIPLPLGAIYNKRSFVYIDNLVSLIVKCIDHPAAANQVFLVSDGSDLSTTDLLRCCAEELGVKVRLLPIPEKMIKVSAALLGKPDVAQRLCGNLQVDITKARTMLGWTPPFSVAQGLRATADSFR